MDGFPRLLLLRARAYVGMCMMLMVALITLCAFVALHPIRYVNLRLYRKLGTTLLELCVPGFVLAPALAGASPVPAGDVPNKGWRSWLVPVSPGRTRDSRGRRAVGDAGRGAKGHQLPYHHV